METKNKREVFTTVGRVCAIIALLLLMPSCGGGERPEDKEAKEAVQGIWFDSDTKEPSIRIEGDSIYYADSTSLPAYFKIIDDSLVIYNFSGSASSYKITRMTDHLLYFRNQNEDEVKLQRNVPENSEEEQEIVEEFIQAEEPKPQVIKEVNKHDTIAYYNNERYHCYVQINPTTYKVISTFYNEDGIEVSNVYYDNIVNLNIFNGKRKVFSKDFRKNMFEGKVPEEFLKQAILKDMELKEVSENGIDHNAVLVQPDDESAEFRVTVRVDYDGNMTILENK